MKLVQFKTPAMTSAAMLVVSLGSLGSLTSCTKDHDFRLKQVDQNFAAARESKQVQEFKTSVGRDNTQAFRAAQEIKHKFDLLWVIDNSASMEPSQEKLRKGLTQFAKKYLRPDWDIQIAVITTDTFLAHPSFRKYLTTPAKDSSTRSAYLKEKLSALPATAQPASLAAIFNVQTGKFTTNLKPTDLIPALGADYAKLAPGKGIHDGPAATLCFDGYYMGFGDIHAKPVACAQREELAQSDAGATFKNSGLDSCLNASGATAISQCVNTLLNDTLHSGKPILSTIATESTAKLARDFMINASVGTSGSGSERGFSSVLQLLSDNETAESESRFFRAGSKRLVVFVSDEDDQSVKIPENPGDDFTPTAGYVNNCPRTVKGHAYSISICPKAEDLLPVSEIKEKLDHFFAALDGSAKTDRTSGNYAVAAIVPMSWETLAGFGVKESSKASKATTHQDYGRRYLELVKLVGGESSAMDIAAENYSDILDRIGKVVSQGFKTYTLDPLPTENETLSVLIIGKNGKESKLPADAYQISGNTLTISDEALVNLFKPDDKLVVQYEARRFSQFPLERAPTAEESVMVAIQHLDGKTTAVSADQYQINDKTLVLTDQAVISALQLTDEVKIKFEMRRLNEYLLTREATTEEEMIVKIVRGDGSEKVLAMGQYEMRGKLLVITDSTITASLKATDRVLVNYQPRTIQ